MPTSAPAVHGAAHDDWSSRLPSLRLVASPRWPRRLAKFTFACLVIVLLAMLLAPWQQSVRGSGQVVAFAPLERQQIVEANISGRVFRWGDEIREGVRVTRGQVILELRDIDPAALERLEQQRDASVAKLQASEAIAAAYEAKLNAVRDGQAKAIAAAEQEVEMAQQKVEAEQQGLAAAEAAQTQALAYLQRKQSLLDDQLASPQDVEIAQRKHLESVAKVKQAEAYLASAINGLEAKKLQLDQKRREAEGYVEAARAEYQKALGEQALARKELTDVEGKLSKQQNQIIRAPRDGTIVRLLAYEGGAIVKEGDPLFELVPESADRAVEIWVSGNDAPLISPGRHVRLQFEGWPAVQFAGWPSVAVGTFGGTVAVVDATDNGKGQFRVLVKPADADAWPDVRYLRQGVRANGWVLLNEVSLGYEIWRQLNGFPPVVAPAEPKDDKEKKDKPPKVKM